VGRGRTVSRVLFHQFETAAANMRRRLTTRGDTMRLGTDMEGLVKPLPPLNKRQIYRLETQSRAGTDDGNHPDIRGSAKLLPQSSETSPPSRLRLIAASWVSHSVLEDSRRELPTSTATQARSESSCAGLHALADGPDKTSELASDRSHRLRSTDAAVEVVIALMKPSLCSDGKIDEVG